MATRAIPIRTGSLRDAAHDIAECFSEHSLLTYASAIAFRAIVALVPLTLLGLALLGTFGLEDVWTDTIAPALRDHLTQPVFNGIDFTVQQIFATDKTPLIALATALVIWDMTWAVNAVTQALNRIHEVQERRSKLRRILVASGLGIVVVACLIAAVLVQSIAPSVTDGALDTLLSIARWPVAILFLWAAVTLLFRYAPAEKPKTRRASGGSLLVIATWLVASVLFRGWVTEVANFKSAAGSLTVFLVLTSYILVSSMIFLIGAEVDERHHRHRIEEVHADHPVRPARRGGKRGDRDRGRVRGQDRLGWEYRVRLAEDLLLHGLVLHDRLDHEVGRDDPLDRRDAAENVFESDVGALGSKPLEALPHCGQTLIHRSGSGIVKRHAPSGCGQHLGDAAAHLTRADDEDVLEAHGGQLTSGGSACARARRPRRR